MDTHGQGYFLENQLQVFFLRHLRMAYIKLNCLENNLILNSVHFTREKKSHYVY